MSTPSNPTPRQVTQARHPWRATVRTAVAFIIGVAVLMPAIVDASGLPQTTGAVSLALAVSGAITRILAIPGVEKLLRASPFTSWLAAAPDQP